MMSGSKMKALSSRNMKSTMMRTARIDAIAAYEPRRVAGIMLVARRAAERK